MQHYTMDQFGYSTGLMFPIEVPGYKHTIFNVNDWQDFIAWMQQAQANDCNCVVDSQSCPACRTQAAKTYPLAEQF